MKQEFSGEITNVASHTSSDHKETMQEWLLTIEENLNDSDWPEFSIDLTTGVRWGLHQNIGWWFDFKPEDLSIEYLKEVQEARKEFLAFTVAVERARVAYDAAIARLQYMIAKKLEGEQDGQDQS